MEEFDHQLKTYYLQMEDQFKCIKSSRTVFCLFDKPLTCFKVYRFLKTNPKININELKEAGMEIEEESKILEYQYKIRLLSIVTEF